MSAPAIDALMRRAIDYAGVFPPARLPVVDAIAEYTRVRGSAHGWMIGTFIVSSDALSALSPGLTVPAHVRDVPLNVVMRDAASETLRDVRRAGERLQIAALEFPPLPDTAIRATAASAGSFQTRLFFEVGTASAEATAVRATQDMEAVLDAIAAAGAFAKIRTGGVTASAFPDATAVDRFLRACVARRLPCKATAGLHHASTGSYPLTYEAGSADARMFGFLNLVAAATLVYAGASERDVTSLLADQSPGAVAVGAGALTWRGYTITTRNIEAVRRELLLSFGSCSAQEPINDLLRMHLA